jgi:hypothetical protein
MKSKEEIKKERHNNPVKRDEYLRKCGEQADSIFAALARNGAELSEDAYLSIAETAEYLEKESIGIEGIDF